MDIEVDKALMERAQQKRQQRNALRDRVKQLMLSGATRVEIMTRLGISSGFYYRLTNEIRSEARGAHWATR